MNHMYVCKEFTRNIIPSNNSFLLYSQQNILDEMVVIVCVCECYLDPYNLTIHQRHVFLICDDLLSSLNDSTWEAHEELRENAKYVLRIIRDSYKRPRFRVNKDAKVRFQLMTHIR